VRIKGTIEAFCTTKLTWFASAILYIMVFTLGAQVCHYFHLFGRYTPHAQAYNLQNYLKSHHSVVSEVVSKSITTEPEIIIAETERIDIIFAVVSNAGAWDSLQSLATAYDMSIEKFNAQKMSTRVIFFACHNEKEQIQKFEKSTTIAVKLPCDDSYDGLLNKTRTIRRWVLQTISFTFLVKVDDDVVINMNHFFNAMNFLLKEHPQKMYAGDLGGVVPVETDPKSKWSDLNYASVQSIYPLYANGYCYILSSDLVELLVQFDVTSPELRKSHAEDVFVGMMLMLAQNVTYVPLAPHKMLLKRSCSYDVGKGLWSIFCHTRPTPPMEKRLEVWKRTYENTNVKQNAFKMGKIWNELSRRAFTYDEWFSGMKGRDFMRNGFTVEKWYKLGKPILSHKKWKYFNWSESVT